ncbi:hypothetical protein [uncultured Gammaproteobacteria bacterium]|nr:hypothetical protein [uncultured Gammaproteobacteria bacterium]
MWEDAYTTSAYDVVLFGISHVDISATRDLHYVFPKTFKLGGFQIL